MLCIGWVKRKSNTCLFCPQNGLFDSIKSGNQVKIDIKKGWPLPSFSNLTKPISMKKTSLVFLIVHDKYKLCLR